MPESPVTQMPEGTVARSSMGFIFLRVEGGYRVLAESLDPERVIPNGDMFDRDVHDGTLTVLYRPGYVTTVTPKEA